MAQSQTTQQYDKSAEAANVQPTVRRPRRRRRTTNSMTGTSGRDEFVAASYARYSSDDQREESIRDQQRKCREAAGKNDHQIVPDFEFTDEAVSGTKLRRAGLDSLLRSAEAREFHVLYLHSLSRLARESVITMPMLKQLVHVFGVRVISTTEGIDSARDGWEVIASIMSLMHERYIKELSANVFRGQEGTVLAGFAVGDHCFGYKTMPIKGSESTRRGKNAKPRMSYQIDPVTSTLVVRIFYWFVRDHRSLRWITRELNRRRAPKDHRATTKDWHHQQVAGLLGRVKYVGSWPWGEKKNVRDPLTGSLRQDERPEEECEKWIRDFPHLRIIDDELFDGAQRLLDANIERHVATRRSNGTLAGSKRGSAAPRHLLSGLIVCGECGSIFHVGGTNGHYLFCPTYRKGSCSCKTQLRRDRAERMILEQIGTRILENEDWFTVVFDRLRRSWREGERKQPTELVAAENSLADIDRKIECLVDRIENGDKDPAIKERQSQRRSERRDQIKVVDRLRKANEHTLPEPTEEWLRAELRQFGEDLHTDTPAAAVALRDLVGGKIVVTEVKQEGRKRYDLQGRFTIKAAAIATAVAGFPVATEPSHEDSVDDLAEEIVIVFVDPNPLDGPSEEVKRLDDQHLPNKEIAKRLGVSKSQITKLLKHWYESRGLTMPDGRSRRSSLPQEYFEPPMYQLISDEVHRLCDEGLLLGEIAKQLKCDPNTITKAVAFWYESRGLEVPDGRTRRKSLERKVTKPRPADGDDSNGAESVA